MVRTVLKFLQHLTDCERNHTAMLKFTIGSILVLAILSSMGGIIFLDIWSRNRNGKNCSEIPAASY